MDALKQWNLPQPQSDVTLVLLNELVERKMEEKQYKAKSQFYSYVFMLLLVGSGGLIVYQLQVSTSILWEVFSFSRAPFIVILIMLTGFVYYLLRRVTKKLKKAEDELDSLRLEVIDRSEELWKNESQWEKRHDVFTYMKDNFDINLFYK
ncbi:DUF2663 family protein [Guptibacillus algicola]|uniref:DUF2663 family protein n=1 Tax=Guptibacillus algicola TaxID=225844 RepID=UPI001CD5538F|nr:DUF2663 family protein [Alkalihalobacillus algicola]MCA0985822.1 YpbF family protein [Alkalihalobacillus algicola]